MLIIIAIILSDTQFVKSQPPNLPNQHLNGPSYNLPVTYYNYPDIVKPEYDGNQPQPPHPPVPTYLGNPNQGYVSYVDQQQYEDPNNPNVVNPEGFYQFREPDPGSDEDPNEPNVVNRKDFNQFRGPDAEYDVMLFRGGRRYRRRKKGRNQGGDGGETVLDRVEAFLKKNGRTARVGVVFKLGLAGLDSMKGLYALLMRACEEENAAKAIDTFLDPFQKIADVLGSNTILHKAIGWVRKEAKGLSRNF